MQNLVQYLQSIHFHLLTLPQKIELKNKGRPIPRLSLQQDASSSISRSYIRKFNCSVYDKALRLCGCN